MARNLEPWFSHLSDGVGALALAEGGRSEASSGSDEGASAFGRQSIAQTLIFLPKCFALPGKTISVLALY